MNQPNPALVTQRGARRLPRLALLLLCAAYVLPGVFGRDPWRNADLVAYGRMLSVAEGRTPWLAPALGGVADDTALLPHWLGAAFIRLLSPFAPFIAPDVAARIPFALLLTATLALVWYACLNLARTEAAQPVPFAFGGEADPIDYARAIADGAVLALIATLGLLQLGHETTPELAQLAAMALYLWALAALPYRTGPARAMAFVALAALAGSGAPAMGLAAGLGGVLVCWRSSYAAARASLPWVAAATALGAVFATVLGAWRWRAQPLGLDDVPGLARQWLWFMWPTWLLALWTLARWRRQLADRHIAVPLVGVVVALGTSLATGGSDRALLLALPGLALLAAFALPTFKRSAAAAIDWFSVFFFSATALVIWVVYVAVQTGVPGAPARNVARLLPGFHYPFNAVELALALAGTLAWLWLVRWRSGRHREAVWKSMVLPASGVALNWLLAMTLALPALDHARSARPAVQRLARYVPEGACIAAPRASPVLVAAIEVFGHWPIDATPGALERGCGWRVAVVRTPDKPAAFAGWEFVTTVRGPRDRDSAAAVYRRKP